MKKLKNLVLMLVVILITGLVSCKKEVTPPSPKCGEVVMVIPAGPVRYSNTNLFIETYKVVVRFSDGSEKSFICSVPNPFPNNKYCE